MLSTACREIPNRPDYKPVLYAGNSAIGGITRAQSHENISCQDPKMDNYVAMSYDTLACLYMTYINNCSAYIQQKVSCPNISQKDIDQFVKAYSK